LSGCGPCRGRQGQGRSRERGTAEGSHVTAAVSSYRSQGDVVEIAFYIAAIVAVLATLRVVMHTNAVRALLYLVVSLLAVAVAFYTLGAPFAAALEVIVYAGAIMVLFVFVVMMLNLNIETIDRERRWLESVGWAGPAIMAVILLAVMLVTLWSGSGGATVSGDPLYAKAVGEMLFGPY